MYTPMWLPAFADRATDNWKIYFMTISRWITFSVCKIILFIGYCKWVEINNPELVLRVRHFFVLFFFVFQFEILLVVGSIVSGGVFLFVGFVLLFQHYPIKVMTGNNDFLSYWYDDMRQPHWEQSKDNCPKTTFLCMCVYVCVLLEMVNSNEPTNERPEREKKISKS
jgi:hypothetical protein